MMGLSQSNRSGSDANKSSLLEINGTYINTQISVISMNSSQDSSFCQRSIMKEIAQGESNRTDGGVVFQATNCGCALIDASPELCQAGVSSHMKLLNWNTLIRLVKEPVNDIVLLRLHRINSDLSPIQHRPKIRFFSLKFTLKQFHSFETPSRRISNFPQETQGIVDVPRDSSGSISSDIAQMFSLLQSIFKILLRIYKKILLFLPPSIRSKLEHTVVGVLLLAFFLGFKEILEVVCTLGVGGVVFVSITLLVGYGLLEAGIFISRISKRSKISEKIRDD
nr:hypothetical protein CFP56_66656 [Quercus suber]